MCHSVTRCVRARVSVCVCVCVYLHAHVTFERAGRVTGELPSTAAHRSCTPALACSTVAPHTHTYTRTCTHANTCLIDQIDLHMSDGANFSPFPPPANLWPLIYARVNLYTVIMLPCSPFTHTHSHAGAGGIVCHGALTHAPAVSAQVA